MKPIKFQDGNFRFYVVDYESGKEIVFRCRSNRNPRVRAKEKGINGYNNMTKAPQAYIDLWLKYHPEIQPV